MGCTVSGEVGTRSRCKPSLPVPQRETRVRGREADLLRQSWSMVEPNATLVGKKIFLCIFDLRPEVKDIFPFRGRWGDSLITHPQFQAHAQRFMLTIKLAVENLGDLSTFSLRLAGLGKTHAHHVGFKAEYFDVFLAAMVYVWEQELHGFLTGEAHEAWSKLFAFIISKLKEGYLLESKTKRMSVLSVDHSAHAGNANQ